MKIRKTVTQKVIEANRKNGRRSSGPTTARGKDAMRHNAVTHGLLARALVFKNEKEKYSFRTYSKRLCDDLTPADALETMYVEDLANAEWRLKRATRWEQHIRMGNDTTELVEDALQSSTEKLGISYLSAMESTRRWRCKELRFSLTNDEDSKHGSHTSLQTLVQPPPYQRKDDSLSGDRGGVELTAKLTDPLDDLDTILRYQRAIRRDRDNAADRLLRLQRARSKASGKAD
jgi:hypothetical protein